MKTQTKFKEGITVKTTVYMSTDDAGEEIKLGTEGIVFSEPSDRAGLVVVMINGSINYLPQDVLDIKPVERVLFFSKGIVLGNYWGGGSGGYAATKFSADTLDELIAKNEGALKDGSLDSGMGYESLIGAILDITTKTVIDFNGKEFINEENEIMFIGDLTEAQSNFLEGAFFNS